MTSIASTNFNVAKKASQGITLQPPHRFLTSAHHWIA